uniref:Uncharacterized protein n=1 Tax=Anguilla anguilla TaxID=7936 RepID=A0A0E9QDL3_ANGAN
MSKYQNQFKKFRCKKYLNNLNPLLIRIDALHKLCSECCVVKENLYFKY